MRLAFVALICAPLAVFAHEPEYSAPYNKECSLAKVNLVPVQKAAAPRTYHAFAKITSCQCMRVRSACGCGTMSRCSKGIYGCATQEDEYDLGEVRTLCSVGAECRTAECKRNADIQRAHNTHQQVQARLKHIVPHKVFTVEYINDGHLDTNYVNKMNACAQEDASASTISPSQSTLGSKVVKGALLLGAAKMAHDVYQAPAGTHSAKIVAGKNYLADKINQVRGKPTSAQTPVAAK